MSGIARDLGKIETNGEGMSLDFEETILKWKESCHLIHFIYESVYNIYSRIQKILGVLILLLTTINSFLLVAEMNQIVVTTISLLTTFISGIGQIYVIQDRSQSYLEYLKDIQDFYILLNSRLFLPSDGKISAEKFVIEKKEHFTNLMSSAPEIPNFLYRRYMNKYQSEKISSRRTGQLFRITN